MPWRRRGGWHLCRALGVACVAVLTSPPTEARADIDPPPGLSWVLDSHLMLENAESFPEWVFVSFPCSSRGGAPFAIEPYCIVRQNDQVPAGEIDKQGTLYAVRAKDVTIVAEAKKGPDYGAWLIERPKIEDPSAFFARAPIVARPGFLPEVRWAETVPTGLGIQSATYFLHIDDVGASGVKAHFSRASYRCASGKTVDLPWQKGSEMPPLPECDTVGPPHATVVPDLPQGETHRPALWAGLAIVGASLLFGGLLLRAEAKRQGE